MQTQGRKRSHKSNITSQPTSPNTWLMLHFEYNIFDTYRCGARPQWQFTGAQLVCAVLPADLSSQYMNVGLVYSQPIHIHSLSSCLPPSLSLTDTHTHARLQNVGLLIFELCGQAALNGLAPWVRCTIASGCASLKLSPGATSNPCRFTILIWSVSLSLPLSSPPPSCPLVASLILTFVVLFPSPRGNPVITIKQPASFFFFTLVCVYTVYFFLGYSRKGKLFMAVRHVGWKHEWLYIWPFIIQMIFFLPNHSTIPTCARINFIVFYQFCILYFNIIWKATHDTF